MNLLPGVRQLTYTPQPFSVPTTWVVQSNPLSKAATDELKRYAKIQLATTMAHLRFTLNANLSKEAYVLTIDPSGVSVEHATPNGAFYAVKTLKQLLIQYPTRLPGCIINDEPELAVRGYLLDISRNKIPTLATLMGIVDLLADLKYNHFELYVEGFSFKYPGFDALYGPHDTPLTLNEFMRLQRYCAARMIDLVPNHNGLGHMSAWLALPAYKDLAVMEEGMYMWGAHRAPSTVNPLDPRSLNLVKAYTAPVLKASKSHFFHLNLDEPYELGHGKTEAKAKEVGVGRIYLDYLNELVGHVRAHKKTALVWGDILNQYPELLPELPKELIFVDWGYDADYPFESSLKRLAQHKVRFMAAPGTSTWNSLTGRTTDMIENIANACAAVKHHGGEGVLLTDWGDAGHPQPFAVSWLPLALCAQQSWSTREGALHNATAYLNTILLQDSSTMIGALLADVGRYDRYQRTPKPNATDLMTIFYQATGQTASFAEHLKNHRFGEPEINAMMLREIKDWRLRLKAVKAKNALQRPQLKALGETIDLFETLILSYRALHQDTPSLLRRRTLKKVNTEWPLRIRRFRMHWLRANRISGLDDTVRTFERIAAHLTAIADTDE
jgi:hypothetical protein